MVNPTLVSAFEGADDRRADCDDAAGADAGPPDRFHRAQGDLKSFGERQRMVDLHVAG